ncbi:MAG: DUF3078 domain-containing protein [Paludibacteraceae bacterium]|nr:DUF3078 domain-containing protein [Paludibacteraceae bacterium]
MKKYLLLLLAFCMTPVLFAEEVAAETSPWSCTGIVGLNASATGLVNWAAGGNNNVTGVAFGKVRLLYSGENLSWESNLNLEYGLSYIDQKHDPFQKSSDVIDFKTKFGWQFHKAWYLTISGGFKSQFDLGRKYGVSEAYDPIISKFLAPSYTDISVGIDWKPNTIFSVYISPVAGRIRTVYVSDALAKKYATDQADLEKDLKDNYAVWKYEVDEQTGLVKKSHDCNVRAELGLSIKGAINYTYKDLKIITSLGLYTPYAWNKTKIYKDAEGQYYADLGKGNQSYDGMEYVGYQDNNQRFGNFDVDWDASISYQFLKCLNVTLSTSLKYYNGVKIADAEGNLAERVQFKGTLGIGVGYSF